MSDAAGLRVCYVYEDPRRLNFEQLTPAEAEAVAKLIARGLQDL